MHGHLLYISGKHRVHTTFYDRDVAVINLMLTEMVALFEIISTNYSDSFWFYYMLWMSAMAGFNVYLTLAKSTSGPMPYINYLIFFLNVILLLVTAVGNDSPLAPILAIGGAIIGVSTLIWLALKFLKRKKKDF